MTTESSNEYELQRLERIRENRERMQALQLDTLAAAMIPVKRVSPPTQRGLSKRKRLSDGTQPVTRRRSDRIKGVAADGAYVISEGRGGDLTVAGANGITTNGGGTTSPEPYVRHTKDDLPFKSTEYLPQTDAAFIGLLGRVGSLKHHKPAPKSALSATKLCTWQLKGEDVAKLTKDAITHMGFMPTANMCVIAAADKKGFLGLWNVDHDLFPNDVGHNQSAAVKEAKVALGSDASEDEDDDFDGVLSFNLHSQYISGLKWAGEGSAARLYTGSYDGSLRMLDTEKEAFVLAWGDLDMEYSCMDVTPDGRTAYMGTNEGDIDVIDLRSSKRARAKPIEGHDKKVNTVHIEPVNQNQFVTGATDTAVHVWDVRKMGKCVASANHARTCQAAYFAPNGSGKVVSTSFDNTVRIWDSKKGLDPLRSIGHDNQTGRWLLPLRAVWSQHSDAVIVGTNGHNKAGGRCVDVFNASSGELQAQLSSEYMTASVQRNFVHPLLPILASGSGSGRVLLFR